MRHLFALITVVMFLTFTVTAQVTDAEKNLRTESVDTTSGWKTGGVTSLNFGQNSFTNWAAGGQNSITLNGLVSLYANYKKGKSSLDNTLDIGYGRMLQGNGEDKTDIKTDDKFDFTSKYGQKASKNWYYAALLNFKTQMDNGYNYPNDSVVISKFLAPAYLLAAIGMDYKPNQNFSAFIAPFTDKTTIVNDESFADAGAYGVEAAVIDTTTGKIITKGKKIRNEFGGYVRLVYRKDNILKNVNLLTKLDLFSNYLNNPEKVDVSWETLISMKINKYISATVSTHLLYDYDIKFAQDSDGNLITDPEKQDKVQFKEVVGIGFSYNF